ncbi:MAG: methyltransferase domain-containing protein [Acidobacteria bacterium]|nr:methyltransferase domain-containing protein [Acidobacteriota bacterium]
MNPGRRFPRVCWPLLLAIFFAYAVSSLAQVGSRPADQWIPVLESPNRIENLKIPQVVAALHLKQGNVVADIGAGSGLFSRAIAKEIGSGTLYAADIDSELLRHIDATCKTEKIDNVKTVLAVPEDPKLPTQMDLIFICDTLHHIANPDKYLTKLPAYLKSGGRIAVIDFRDNWPAGHESMRYTTEQLESWMKAAGLKKVEDLNIPKEAFFHIYAKE